MGRKIYIDIGSNHGDTIHAFREENPDFTIVGIEPAPLLAAKLRQRFAGPESRVHIMESVAWIFDGTVQFFLGADSDESSTVLLDKRPTPACNVDYDTPYKVQSLDFDRWLRENTSADDTIIIKMDIEGSEYKVLQRMIDSGSLARVSDMRVEWHWDRYPNEITQADHLRIRNKAAAITKITDWR